eukprot:symbB.v1.2.033217.t1/scaffold4095.1/size44818/1
MLLVFPAFRQASPPLRRVQLFAEEAPEPPSPPPEAEVECSSSSEGPAMMSQMSSRPTQRLTKAPPKGLRGRRAKKRLAAAGRAALVIGRLHAEVLDLRKRMVAMEVAPSTSSAPIPSMRREARKHVATNIQLQVMFDRLVGSKRQGEEPASEPPPLR